MGLRTAFLYGLRGKLCGLERGMQIRYPKPSRCEISMREWYNCHYFSQVAKRDLKLHLKLLIPFKNLGL